MCKQQGFPCRIDSGGVHEYINYAATLDRNHRALDALDANWYDHPDRKMAPPRPWDAASMQFMENAKPFMDAMIADGKTPVLHLVMDTHGLVPEEVAPVKEFVKKKISMKDEIPAFSLAINKAQFTLEVHSNNTVVAQAIQEACNELSPPIAVTTHQNPAADVI